jgi:glycosyltransferase involved in cell wall biosynthesis
LQNYPRIPKEKIFVTYEACEDFCMVNPKKEEVVLTQYGIIKPYILYVGNVYPHKNPERLLLAFSLLEKRIKKMKLVFVGSEDYFYKRLKRFVKKNKIKNVIFTGYLPDHDLDVAFRKSVAYIRPSLYEGFELPPLEAMAKGVPVLSSNHSCALEILGDSVLYFDGENTADIAGAIEKIFRDVPLRESLIKKGYERILLYNWKKMAKITLALYESIKK